ncbi:hypothetical protein Q75_16875 [Bacillus coahuilensis p1.1.43]|uniref:Uncharacterized protein n=1 Tax=Bacillus coahuilensis p1.1.43 TaxID=1150625 RepID=A0A147K3W8_9BACI|nr:hypothetical protein [Bacillus coahuilensis]KUP03990.1 hypothetical protein Q75_16875 [Bacillus coahuilensis p1.1.43]
MRGESFDEKVKSLVREEQIPSAVRKGIDEAYERLEDQNSHKKFLGLKSIGLRPIIVFLLSIMILPTIGVIASNNVELFKDGELVMKLTTPSTEVNKWGWQELEDYKSELKPGEAILFYEVDKYPRKRFFHYNVST